jgi:hypothetical protein
VNSSRTKQVALALAVLLAAVLAGSCGDDSPSSATATVTGAPGIVSPTGGATVDNRQPTLTVTNATSTGGSPTYQFQVATDSGFATIVAQQEGVPQGGSQTSWQVTTPLENRGFYWRARAQIGSQAGAYSATAEFQVNAPGFGSEIPVQGLLVYDPLTNGMTVGERLGGEFTPQGWQVTTRSDYIRYGVPTIESGYVEWENSNMEDVVPDKQWMLFGMWDPTRGAYRENPYRVHLQKLDAGHNSPYFRIRWIANGEEHDFGNDFEEWNLFHTYHMRIEWGPGIGSQIVRFFMDGQLQFEETYVNIYRPETHWIEMGIQERKESIIGVIYKNVKIGVK